jgi:hypothetical protein
MLWFQFCGPGGKMPPDTAGKDARRYKSVIGGSARMRPGQPHFKKIA